jgi:hypothetical protein
MNDKVAPMIKHEEVGGIAAELHIFLTLAPDGAEL